jgi:hypothetical protein
MPEITIEEFNPEMTDHTAEVLARAFITNPLNAAAFGVDQVSVNEAFLEAVFESCAEENSSLWTGRVSSALSIG